MLNFCFFIHYFWRKKKFIKKWFELIEILCRGRFCIPMETVLWAKWLIHKFQRYLRLKLSMEILTNSFISSIVNDKSKILNDYLNEYHFKVNDFFISRMKYRKKRPFLCSFGCWIMGANFINIFVLEKSPITERRKKNNRMNSFREILTLSDGGEVALDWTEHNCCPTSPIVIILPGLTGASQAEYIKCLVYAAKNVGIKCVIFNNRGLGGMKLKVRILNRFPPYNAPSLS